MISIHRKIFILFSLLKLTLGNNLVYRNKRASEKKCDQETMTHEMLLKYLKGDLNLKGEKGDVDQRGIKGDIGKPGVNGTKGDKGKKGQKGVRGRLQIIRKKGKVFSILIFLR